MQLEFEASAEPQQHNGVVFKAICSLFRKRHRDMQRALARHVSHVKFSAARLAAPPMRVVGLSCTSRRSKQRPLQRPRDPGSLGPRAVAVVVPAARDWPRESLVAASVLVWVRQVIVV